MASQKGCRNQAKRQAVSLKTIDDLRPAPYNPREITAAAAVGLGESLERFGDLSGIVWNNSTGNLVAGHQRVSELRRRGGVLRDGAVVVGDERFPVRVVDWDETTERAANLAANNPAIAGTFTSGVAEILASVRDADAALYDAVRLGEMAPLIAQSGSGHGSDIVEWDGSAITLRALFVFRVPIEMQPKIRELLRSTYPDLEFGEEVVYA